MTLYMTLYSLYGFITLIFLIMVFFGEKDTWGIKIETSITTSLMLVCVILSYTLPRDPFLTNVVDYIFPIPMILTVYSIGQLIILVTIPTINTIYQDRRKRLNDGCEEQCLYEKLLLERETFNLVLDYSRRSYCSEPVLCFETIEKFRNCRRISIRMKIANNILETFLSKSSPLELNIPKIETLQEELLLLIKEKNETKIDELLENLRLHCLLDMNEMMTRMNSDFPEIFLKAKQQLIVSI